MNLSDNTIGYKLVQNYSHPFNPITRIQYQIPAAVSVQLKVYDLLGSELATLVNEDNPAGSYEVDCNASSVPSGVYFYQVHTQDYLETNKMILVK